MTAAPRSDTTSRVRRHRLRPAAILPAVVLAALGLLTALSTSTRPAPASRPAAAVNHSPIARSIDMYASFGGLRVRGWLFDPDAPTQVITVIPVVDGHAQPAQPASLSRSDVAQEYPKAGAAHGYSFIVPVPEGSHTVCLHARNIGPGNGFTISCKTLVFDYGPVGALNTVDTRPGAVHVRGWTLDPDAVTTALTVRIVVDSRTVATVIANRSRPDVAGVRNGAGPCTASRSSSLPRRANTPSAPSPGTSGTAPTTPWAATR